MTDIENDPEIQAYHAEVDFVMDTLKKAAARAIGLGLDGGVVVEEIEKVMDVAWEELYTVGQNT